MQKKKKLELMMRVPSLCSYALMPLYLYICKHALSISKKVLSPLLTYAVNNK